MKMLVICDSVYGNTEKIAQVITEALAAHGDARLLRVADVQPDDLVGLDLLIVGSPTHAFNSTPVIKTMITNIPKHGLEGVLVTAFDTRIAVEDVDSTVLGGMINLFGYAARPIAHRLEKHGGTVVTPPEGFYVEGKEGPLKEGEVERAAHWVEDTILPEVMKRLSVPVGAGDIQG
jgi:flavodoxin